MKPLRILSLLLICLLAATGCTPRLVPPEADLTKPCRECLPGTVTSITTDQLTLEVKDRASFTITLPEETEYLKLYRDTGETVPITQTDLYIGAWVEIDCESYPQADLYTAHVIQLIEPTA